MARRGCHRLRRQDPRLSARDGRENNIDRNIRFHPTALGAAWDSGTAWWLVDVERTDTDELVQISANWLFLCRRLLPLRPGFTPQFPGRDRFGGQVVHRSTGFEDLDYTGKKVVIIGSGRPR